jgi:hypothetical protein
MCCGCLSVVPTVRSIERRSSVEHLVATCEDLAPIGLRHKRIHDRYDRISDKWVALALAALGNDGRTPGLTRR